MDREEEFAPVKCSNPTASRGETTKTSPEGELDVTAIVADTPEDAQLLLSRLHARWLEAATGRPLPHRSEEGPRRLLCEISPLRSYEGEDLAPDCLGGKDISKPLLLN